MCEQVAGVGHGDWRTNSAWALSYLEPPQFDQCAPFRSVSEGAWLARPRAHSQLVAGKLTLTRKATRPPPRSPEGAPRAKPSRVLAALARETPPRTAWPRARGCAPAAPARSAASAGLQGRRRGFWLQSCATRPHPAGLFDGPPGDGQGATVHGVEATRLHKCSHVPSQTEPLLNRKLQRSSPIHKAIKASHAPVTDWVALTSDDAAPSGTRCAPGDTRFRRACRRLCRCWH